MSNIAFKFIQRLLAPTPLNAPIAEGDRVDEALNKLQGQINVIEDNQQIFIGEPVPLPTYPSLIFSEKTIDGQTVYEMQVNVP